MKAAADYNEILKGHIDTIILAALSKKDSFGWEIQSEVVAAGNGKINLTVAAVYTAFKRLEAAALISSYWGEDLIPETEDAAKSGSNARRKYYKITEKGMNYYFQKRDEWRIVSEIINKLILS